MSNKIILTDDGSHSMLSENHGVSYHSKHGAIQETQHVFIDAAFRQKIPSSSLSILDIGFGTGLNAFMTYLEAEKTQCHVNYVGIEAYPISMEKADQLNFTELLNQDKTIFQKLHHCDWEIQHSISEYFFFEKNKTKFEELKFKDQFDIIYFDAFAPNAQPELWEESILASMFKALKEDGILTTYCAKGVVKRTLKKVGFKIEAIPGPPGKREMTRARKTNS